MSGQEAPRSVSQAASAPAPQVPAPRPRVRCLGEAPPGAGDATDRFLTAYASGALRSPDVGAELASHFDVVHEPLAEPGGPRRIEILDARGAVVATLRESASADLAPDALLALLRQARTVPAR